MFNTTSYPIIFIDIDILKKDEATRYVKLRSLDYQTPKKRVKKEKLNFLMNQYCKFQNEEISYHGYLQIQY